jgi:hypothetical protein
MKIPQNSKTLIIAAVLVMIGLFAGIGILLVPPREPLDLSKEEAPFHAIQMPPQAVQGSEYMDGGSVGIFIQDHSGMVHELFFELDYEGIRSAHPTAFYRASRANKPIPLKNPERAKEIAIRLIDDHGKERTHPDSESANHTAAARRALASPPSVVAGRAYHKIRRALGY